VTAYFRRFWALRSAPSRKEFDAEGSGHPAPRFGHTRPSFGGGRLVGWLVGWLLTDSGTSWLLRMDEWTRFGRFVGVAAFSATRHAATC
jgi:hypothetical protein